MSQTTRKSLALALIIGILCLDQLTKWLTDTYIPLMTYPSTYPYGGYGIFRDFLGIEFSISHLTNHGAAWGVLADFQVYLLGLRIVLIAGMAWYALFINKNEGWILPLSLIVAGAVGNVLDYFVYGHVVDMLKFVFWGYEYPVFNLADSAVFLGVVWIALLSLLSNEHPTAMCGKRRHVS